MLKPNLKKLGFALLIAAGCVPQTHANLTFGAGASLAASVFSSKLGFKGAGLPTGSFGQKDEQIKKLLSLYAYNTETSGSDSKLFKADVAAAGVQVDDNIYPVERGSGVPGRAYVADENLVIDRDADDENAHRGYNNAASERDRLAEQILRLVKEKTTPFASLMAASGKWSELSGDFADNVTEFDTERTSLGRSLRVLLDAIIKYGIEGTPLAIGAGVELGVSFIELKAKNFHGADLKESEGMYLKASVVLGITDYFELHAGFGLVRKTLEYTQGKDVKDLFAEYNRLVSNSKEVGDSFAKYADTPTNQPYAKAPANNLSAYLAQADINTDKATNWVVSGSIVGKVILPVNSALSVILSAGVEMPITGTEREIFKKSASSKKIELDKQSNQVLLGVGARYTM